MMRSFNDSFHSQNKDLIIDSYDYLSKENKDKVIGVWSVETANEGARSEPSVINIPPSGSFFIFDIKSLLPLFRIRVYVKPACRDENPEVDFQDRD